MLADCRRDRIQQSVARNAPWASFDYAGPLSELVMIGNIATQCQEALEYDPTAGRFAGQTPANELLSYAYRAGWTL